MRIISGKWRSRKIDWPSSGRTRPITDRVREAVFAVLGSYYDTPGELPPVHVGDVFAGGGSLGLESMSRGAARVCFFERDADALESLKSNLKALAAGPEAQIVVTDLWRTGVKPPEGFAPLDLVFLDPPFPDASELSNRSKVGSLLRRLTVGPVVRQDALVVFRHECRVRPPELVGRHWTTVDRREYGASAITLLRPVENRTTDPVETVTEAGDA